jgi:predicted component of viral defense system (DUF524 family)
MLTDNEKAAIINAHIRNIEVNKYNAETSIMAEEALDSPSSEFISNQNSRIEQFDAQITALQTELSKLNVTEDSSSYTQPTSSPTAP